MQFDFRLLGAIGSLLIVFVGLSNLLIGVIELMRNRDADASFAIFAAVVGGGFVIIVGFISLGGVLLVPHIRILGGSIQLALGVLGIAAYFFSSTPINNSLDVIAFRIAAILLLIGGITAIFDFGRSSN